MKFNFLDMLSKNTQISNFVKIRQVRGRRVVPCERMDRRTDMTKLMVAFLNSANAPINVVIERLQLSQSMQFTGEQLL